MEASRKDPWEKNHRVTKPIRLEKMSEIVKSNLWQIPTTEGHFQEFLGHLQGWGLQTALGSSFPPLITLPGKKFLLKPNLNLKALSSPPDNEANPPKNCTSPL